MLTAILFLEPDGPARGREDQTHAHSGENLDRCTTLIALSEMPLRRNLIFNQTRNKSKGGSKMCRTIVGVLLTLTIGSSAALAEDMKLPPLQRQPTPQAVIDEHLDALNKCDWKRIMAQYPEDYQLNLPDGVVVKGRQKAAELFAGFVKPHDQGGLCGMKFTPEQTFAVGETLNIQWKAEAEFLAEPYRGSDAYETHDGLMVAMVSTFKGADLKLKSAASSTRQ